MDGQAIMYPIRLISGCDGEAYEVDWRDAEELFRRDPEARPANDDPNVLNLSAHDCVLL
jgi:hypothetical protein